MRADFRVPAWLAFPTTLVRFNPLHWPTEQRCDVRAPASSYVDVVAAPGTVLRVHLFRGRGNAALGVRVEVHRTNLMPFAASPMASTGGAGTMVDDAGEHTLHAKQATTWQVSPRGALGPKQGLEVRCTPAAYWEGLGERDLWENEDTTTAREATDCCIAAANVVVGCGAAHADATLLFSPTRRMSAVIAFGDDLDDECVRDIIRSAVPPPAEFSSAAGAVPTAEQGQPAHRRTVDVLIQAVCVLPCGVQRRQSCTASE